jgi:hypothetical protein
MSRTHLAALRLLAALMAVFSLGACTNGINAGVDGGVAFIVFAGMLILMVGILYLILGRED